jgi:hypothetical protein
LTGMHSRLTHRSGCAVQAAATAFPGSRFSESEAAPLCAMLARRAEALLEEHGPPHADGSAHAHARGTHHRTGQAAARSGTQRLDQLAALASGFGELRVYNPRLMEVIHCSLAPSVTSASYQLEQLAGTAPATRSTEQSAGLAPALISEQALRKLCWSVGRLGPPLPELHASLGTLACVTLPHAQEMETLAKVSWWSAVMQGLDPSGPVPLPTVGLETIEAPVPAAVSRRLAQLVGEQTLHGSDSSMWDNSVSNVLWGLACHEWQGSEFANTFWSALGPEPAATHMHTSDSRRRRRRSIAMSCRLHQCMIEIEMSTRGQQQRQHRQQLPEAGWQRDLAVSCHHAFLKSARKTTQQARSSSSSSSSSPAQSDNTMQERVGKMLRRASDSPIEYEVVLPSGYTVDLLVRPIDRTGRSQSHRPDSPGLAQGVDRPIAVEVRTRKDFRVVGAAACATTISCGGDRPYTNHTCAECGHCTCRWTAPRTFSTRARCRAVRR